MEPIKNKNFFRAATAAVNGFLVLTKEAAFQRECWLVLLALIACAVNGNTFSFFMVLISVTALAVEALNTAIEKLCNYVQLAHDDRIKEIKDLGAAAIFILLSLYFSVSFVWLIVTVRS